MKYLKRLFFCLGLGLGLHPSIITAEDLLYVEVMDDATSSRTVISSFTDIKNKTFRSFVEGVSRSLGLNDIRFEKPHGPGRTVTFTRVPLVSSGETQIVATPTQSDAICSSPMGVISKIDGQLHASLVWNERLVLQDEAVATGHLAETNQTLGSFTQSDFAMFADCYAARSFGGSSGSCAAGTEVPPELQMLFEAAPQSGLLPFHSTVLAYFNKTLPARVGAYIERANEFVTGCTK